MEKLRMSEVTHSCWHCSERFKCVDDLYKHVAAHKVHNNEEQFDSTDSGCYVKKYNCYYCQASFQDSMELFDHVEIHDSNCSSEND